MKIDLHTHFLPRDCFNMTDREGRIYGHTMRKDVSGQEVLDGGSQSSAEPSVAQLCDPERRIYDMDKIGLDIQVLSLAPRNIQYTLEPAEGLRHSQKYNNGIAESVRAYPHRFVGMATVPMQDVTKAIIELERAVHELGLKAVEILSDINGKNLDEKEFWPFYQKVQELDIPLYVHPTTSNTEPRLQRYMLQGLMGIHFNTTLAIASVIFGGVLESFPRLRFLFSHAGGAAPFIIGRWDHCYQLFKPCQSIPKPPSEYFQMMYFDTIAYLNPAVAYLTNMVGADKVVIGSDYPYGTGDSDPVATISKAAGISADDKERIMEHTPAVLLKLAI